MDIKLKEMETRVREARLNLKLNQVDLTEKPNFKYKAPVCFRINGNLKNDTIAIIDAYGTFRYSKDVCYDICVETENCLYKHIQEQYVEPYGETSK